MYSITIESDIKLHELIEDYKHQPDVFIKLGIVPKHLPNATDKGVFYEVAYNDYLLKLETVGFFRAENGTQITIMPCADSNPSDIRLFLLSSTIGAILHQRGVLPFHGSTILTGKGLLTVTGNSAVGKSSIAAGFLEAGYKLLSDDISAITFEEDSSMFVHPGIPYLKVWKDVLIYLNRTENLERVRPSMEKYKLPLLNAFHNRPEMPEIILFLAPKNRNGFHIEEINGIEKFSILGNNVYRNNLIDGLGRTQTNFEQLTNLANKINLFRLERPSNPIMIKELIDFIVDEIIETD